MKKLYMVALALVLISPFAFVNANENGEREQKNERAWFQMSEEKRDAMKERQELMKEKMEEHREEWKEKREDFRREHAQVFIERIKAHFEWAIKWTQNIHDRMLAHVEKIEDETDEDLSVARKYLADAQTHIDEALDALEDIVIPDDSDDTTTDEEDTAKVESVRALFTEVKEHIQEARESLRGAMTELKAHRPSRGSEKSEDSE